MKLLELVPHGGSQDHAFEEFCCQLALAGVADRSGFLRFGGDGGDGGVECIWTTPEGEVHGWQAKFIPDVDRALAKTAESFQRARTRHRGLVRYVLCLPFDLQGSKGKGDRGQSQVEKFHALKRRLEAEAQAAEQRIVIELWSLSVLDSLLTDADPSGGRRRYWTAPKHLGSSWFSAQLDGAVRSAGPRYRPELHHGHALYEVLAALGSTPDWHTRRDELRETISAAAESWRGRTEPRAHDNWAGPFPAEARDSGERLAAGLAALSRALQEGEFVRALDEATTASAVATITCGDLARALDSQHGRGSAGSKSFRDHRAEVMADRPADHLDDARRITGLLYDLTSWLSSPAVASNRDRVLVLTGPAGIGKTHGLCDAAAGRRTLGRRSLLVFGGQFGEALWPSFVAALGLDGSWSKDALLDALDAAAGPHRLLICVDALDDRTLRRQWRSDLPSLVEAVQRRPNLALIVSFRDAYRAQVMPATEVWPTFEHPGFSGEVFDACSAFFRHYNLDPPTGPFLDPEFANPLFLRVVCEALQSQGLRALPVGWGGIRKALAELLRHRDREVQEELGGAGNSVTAAMRALAAALPDSGPILWNAAESAVEAAMSGTVRNRGMLDRLVGLGLLVRQPSPDEGWGCEDSVDIAFGRLRHHLVSDHLLASGST